MTHFEEIYEIAADNYGLITAAEAKEIGVTGAELFRWANSGRLVKKGSGVYRIAHYIPTENDKFAEAVALAGPESFLFGETVLAKEGLALVNPSVLTIGSPRRIRRRLPVWIETIQVNDVPTTCYDGIPSQTLAAAILTCKTRIMRSRLLDAIEQGWKRGLITREEYQMLMKENLDGETT